MQCGLLKMLLFVQPDPLWKQCTRVWCVCPHQNGGWYATRSLGKTSKPDFCVEVAPSRLDGRNSRRTRHLECQRCSSSSAASPIPARLKFEDHPLLATSVTWRPTARTNYPTHPLGPRLGRLCNGLPATVLSGHGVRERPTTITNSHGAQQPPSPVCPAWV